MGQVQYLKMVVLGWMLVWGSTAVMGYSGGTGTELDPYLISTTADLEELSHTVNYLVDWTKYYQLTADLDMATPVIPFTPIGNDITQFTGFFDGKGYTISNLTINLPATDDVGLFGRSTGIISDLGLINVDITGKFQIGGLMGNKKGGTITNCYAKGTVNGAHNVGGLVH